jgi:hypothetical protein
MKRPVWASLIAPLTTPVLYYAAAFVVAFLDPVRRASIGHNLFSGLVVVMAVGAPIAYVATVAAGLPALWIVRRLGPLTIGRTVLVGLVAGIAVAILLAPSLHGELFSIPLAPWHGGLLGAATAAVWYWLAFGQGSGVA